MGQFRPIQINVQFDTFVGRRWVGHQEKSMWMMAEGNSPCTHAKHAAREWAVNARRMPMGVDTIITFVIDGQIHSQASIRECANQKGE